MNHSLGICVGSSTIKLAEVNAQFEVVKSEVIEHKGQPKETLTKIIDLLDKEKVTHISITGRKISTLTNIPSITEPEAIEYALKFSKDLKKNELNAIASLGSESFILYELDDDKNISNIKTGNKCASGTGEFFLQQIGRMNVSVDEAIDQSKDAEPYFVSGRCSVFCKSDCTHALNKGIPVGRVAAGLGFMLAEKVNELMISLPQKNIALAGGVTKNETVIWHLKNKADKIVIPEEAVYLEAFGAACYAMVNNKTANFLIKIEKRGNSFSHLPQLKDYSEKVIFKQSNLENIISDDELIIGLDVGSTTTKAVLLKSENNSVVKSIYLRTNGNPVEASVNCYKELKKYIGETRVKITGLAVTGSGRQIAGLHALTDNIINEIIAHATGAAYFDKEVDTIIEIGGQDAKYTYLVNGVPCDYAMNEACSAGTGSFLEESAKESLGIHYTDIESIAISADNPPNFNDQCAAFIGSDIKNASLENISTENITAGLVYSICMNYINRVKGERKVGNKIFMQGGVCYNKAVPLAMAALLDKEIIIPPDPGLVGAFGAAVELNNRFNSGLAQKSSFDLADLIERKVEFGKSFVCPGTKENCDRGCNINVIKIENKTYPFGGICNKYYNTIHKLHFDSAELDFVARRQKLIFPPVVEKEKRKSIGISRSFYTNILFPLYKTFFEELGFEIILSDEIKQEGINKTASSFCYPAEIAHGMFQDLIDKNPDYIFLPQITELFAEGETRKGKEHSCTCVLAQSEPYYIQSTFKNVKSKIISPVLDFRNGWDFAKEEFIKFAGEINCEKEDAETAFEKAINEFDLVLKKKKEFGRKVLEELKKDKTKTGIVLFGRAYNAFAEEANMGIPRKFASRGFYIIPFDCLSYSEEETVENMNWAIGTELMKASNFVKKHPQLFGAFITNFSCGPDSFIIGYFRDVMKSKPSLTLELDSHSADAGIDTRIEAFVDIIDRYKKSGIEDEPVKDFLPAEIVNENGELKFLDSSGNKFDVKNNNVKLIFPSMGRTTVEFTAAAFRNLGFNAEAVEPSDFNQLMLGRGNTSCKECLPLILTTASLLNYLEKREDENELLCYFMPTASGNCRFSQYYVYLKSLIEKKQIKNVALLTLTAENNYAGLGATAQLDVLRAIITADIFDNIKNTINVIAADKVSAMFIYNHEYKSIISAFEKGRKKVLQQLKQSAEHLSKIEKQISLDDATKVLLAGEIYVRKDEFCSQELITKLAEKNIIVHRAPMLEWMYYVDYVVKNIICTEMNFGEKTEQFIRAALQKRIEKKVKKILSKSGLYEYEEIDIKNIIETGSKFINPALTGESIVIAGSFFKEVIHSIHGLISIGPFACLPARVTEAVLSKESNIQENEKIELLENSDELKKHKTLPFLAIEADGNPFPQIVEARIEAFALQVSRLKEKQNKR
ncbi:MAG: acyl-CoA dehydratase activase [Rhodothermaceae bacterium]